MNCSVKGAESTGGYLVSTLDSTAAGDYCAVCCASTRYECDEGPGGAHSTTAMTLTSQPSCFCQSDDSSCNAEPGANPYPTGNAACSNICTRAVGGPLPSGDAIPDRSPPYCVGTATTKTQPDWIGRGVKGNNCTKGNRQVQIYSVKPTALNVQLTGTLTVSADGDETTPLVEAGGLDFGSYDPYCKGGAPCRPGVLNSFGVVLNFDNYHAHGHTVQDLTVSLVDPTEVGGIGTLNGSDFIYTLPAGAVFGARASVDNQDRYFDLTSDVPVTGTFNVDQGEFTAQLHLSGSVEGVAVTVIGSVSTSSVLNRAPHLGTPVFTNTTTSGPTCASQVGFSVPANDLDGDSLTFFVSEVGGAELYNGGPSAGGASAVFSANMTVGTHKLFIQVADEKGGSESMYKTLVVVDGTPPEITVPPSDVTIGTCGPGANIGTAVVIDNCDGQIPPSDDRPATGFPLGVSYVHWTATDSAGNAIPSPYAQRVTVAGKPTFVAPLPPKQVNASACDATPPDLGQAHAVDICGTTITNIVNDAPTSGYPLGQRTVTWTATDTKGNSETYTQTVTLGYTDLGDEHAVSTVPNNACLLVTKYPSSWISFVGSIRLQAQGSGSGWPIGLTFSNGKDQNPPNILRCSNSAGAFTGSRSLSGVWQDVGIAPANNRLNSKCPVLIKLGGSGSGNVALAWWANG